MCQLPFLSAAGFGRFQTYLLGYAGLAWAADACEMMLLSFVGPAVRGRTLPACSPAVLLGIYQSSPGRHRCSTRIPS